MRINFTNIKYPLTAIFAAYSINQAVAQTHRQEITTKPDTFQISNPVDKYTQEDLPKVFREAVNPSSWTNDPEILSEAPSPVFKLKGQQTIAKGVVDVTNSRFYVYDENGKPVESFTIANGKRSTPTTLGVRKVISKMVYPYSNCPRASKRYRFPADYGPKIAYVNIVDTITGNLRDNGEYCHGTRHESALLGANRKVTHGCVRFHNRDALYVITDVLKIGDYLKFVR